MDPRVSLHTHSCSLSSTVWRRVQKNPNPIISTLVVLLMSQSQLQHFFCTYILIFLDIHSNRSHIEGGGRGKRMSPSLWNSVEMLAILCAYYRLDEAGWCEKQTKSPIWKLATVWCVLGNLREVKTDEMTQSVPVLETRHRTMNFWGVSVEYSCSLCLLSLHSWA